MKRTTPTQSTTTVTTMMPITKAMEVESELDMKRAGTKVWVMKIPTEMFEEWQSKQDGKILGIMAFEDQKSAKVDGGDDEEKEGEEERTIGGTIIEETREGKRMRKFEITTKQQQQQQGEGEREQVISETTDGRFGIVGKVTGK